MKPIKDYLTPAVKLNGARFVHKDEDGETSLRYSDEWIVTHIKPNGNRKDKHFADLDEAMRLFMDHVR